MSKVLVEAWIPSRLEAKVLATRTQGQIHEISISIGAYDKAITTDSTQIGQLGQLIGLFPKDFCAAILSEQKIPTWLSRTNRWPVSASTARPDTLVKPIILNSRGGEL